jgi:double-strand break repair protein MRE11
MVDFRHVALLSIQGKEFELQPIALRTVRPFVIEDVDMAEAAEEHNFDVTDQIAIGKFLKTRVRGNKNRAKSIVY